MMKYDACLEMWNYLEDCEKKVSEREIERGRDGRFVCPFRLLCSSVRFGDGESSQTPDSSSDPTQKNTRPQAHI